jgi:hypothetical protein
MPMVGVAPCQCFSPGGNQTMSPGCTSSTGLPTRWTQPQPAVIIQWVGVPRRPGTGLKRDVGTRRTGGGMGLQ